MFLKKEICGEDMGRKVKTRIPEAQGVITGCIFMMITYSMIPVWYLTLKAKEPFPHAQFNNLLGIISHKMSLITIFGHLWNQVANFEAKLHNKLLIF